MKRLISIKEARKLLGRNYDELSDARIDEVINTLSLIAKEMLEKASKCEPPNQGPRPNHSDSENNG